jgi:PPE family
VTREELEVTRWRGFSHAELYAQLQSGPGATASAIPASRWADLAGTLHDINQDLSQAIAQARSSWSGTAANAAFKQLSEVADWAGPAGESASAMQAGIEQQADHIGRARAAMPAPGAEPSPQPDPLLAPVVQLISLQSDHEPIERATSDAARKAFEVMQTYQNDTTTTTDALPAFAEPADTSGHHQQRNRGPLGVLGITTHASSAGPDYHAHVPEQQYRQQHQFWGEGRVRGDLVTQSGAVGYFAEPDMDVRRPVAPLQQGSMAGADPLGSPIASTPQRDTTGRRSSPGATGKIPVPSLDSNVLSGAAPPPPGSASGVSPSAAPTTGAGMAGGSDRVMPRRMGEPLVPGQWLDDAVEPVSHAKRRRDQQDEKITESVEGSTAEVPPSVIGNGPYRQ